VTSGCLVILVFFQVNHGSVIITVDTSESKRPDLSSGAELVPN